MAVEGRFKALALLPQHLDLNLVYICMTLRKVPNLYVPQYLYFLNDDNNITYFIQLLVILFI